MSANLNKWVKAIEIVIAVLSVIANFVADNNDS